jgi:hypothetical protein
MGIALLGLAFYMKLFFSATYGSISTEIVIEN